MTIVAFLNPAVVRNRKEFAHVMDVLRDEAALELGEAFAGVSGKRIDAVGMPGIFGRHGVSRAMNGSASNPLFRIAGFFVLLKRLGLGRERAKRLVRWLDEIVDALWPPETDESLEKVLEKDSEMDPQDDHPRFAAARGSREAMRLLLDMKRRQLAYAPTVIAALRRELGAGA